MLFRPLPELLLLLLLRGSLADDTKCLGCPRVAEAEACTSTVCGSVAVYSDADIDAWVASECWTIGGSLSITGTLDKVTATGLARLSRLVAVCGPVLIHQIQNDALRGLEGLEYVGGDLTIQQNAWQSSFGSFYLEDVSALRNLKYVGGSLNVLQNFALTTTAQLAAAFSTTVVVNGGVHACYYPDSGYACKMAGDCVCTSLGKCAADAPVCGGDGDDASLGATCGCAAYDNGATANDAALCVKTADSICYPPNAGDGLCPSDATSCGPTPTPNPTPPSPREKATAVFGAEYGGVALSRSRKRSRWYNGLLAIAVAVAVALLSGLELVLILVAPLFSRNQKRALVFVSVVQHGLVACFVVELWYTGRRTLFYAQLFVEVFAAVASALTIAQLAEERHVYKMRLAKAPIFFNFLLVACVFDLELAPLFPWGGIDDSRLDAFPTARASVASGVLACLKSAIQFYTAAEVLVARDDTDVLVSLTTAATAVELVLLGYRRGAARLAREEPEAPPKGAHLMKLDVVPFKAATRRASRMIDAALRRSSLRRPARESPASPPRESESFELHHNPMI